MSHFFNRDVVLKPLRESVHNGLVVFSEAVAAEAKSLAPVRKSESSTGPGRGPRRLLNDQQVAMAHKMLDRYKPEQASRYLPKQRSDAAAAIANIVTISPRYRNHHPIKLDTKHGLQTPKPIAGLKLNRASGSYAVTPGSAIDAQVNSQGRYELKTKLKNRAVYTAESGQRTLGGRLKASIGITGQQMKMLVVADVYYARYVEFGSRHNRAQPFLLPALASAKKHMTDKVAKEVEAAGFSVSVRG